MPVTKITRRGNRHPSAAYNAATLENAERLIDAVKESGSTGELTNQIQQAQIYLGGVDTSLHKIAEKFNPLNEAQFIDRVLAVLGEYNDDNGDFEVRDEVTVAAYQLGKSFMQGMRDAAKEAK